MTSRPPIPEALKGDASILLELDALRICYEVLLRIDEPTRRRVVAALLRMLDEDSEPS